MKQYILAIDQGTTSSRALLFDENRQVAAVSQREYPQYYPKPGWVEQDPMEIYGSVAAVMHEVLAENGVEPAQLVCIGITNQRETTVVWERSTGKPICNAIVWQCRRTAQVCEEILQDAELTAYIRAATGLLPDAYFSATKLRWILEQVPGAREKAERGELLFGTVDSWLIWKLTGGKQHVTDYTNASRTMLFNIHTLTWDDRLCREFGIPRSMLPEVRKSSGLFGETAVLGRPVPICGAAGDQQAALFGQSCFRRGQVKNTYGTGCFLLMHTGAECIHSRAGLVSTIAASTEGVRYALEGSVFTGGAVIQWLRDEMGLISTAAESEAYARRVSDTGGVYLVPAFTGLGAPYWDMYARGTIVGITRGTKREHIVRAALESIAYQSAELISAMEADIGEKITALRVDGGAAKNDFLMQFQADVSGTAVIRPPHPESTALGAAMLAGFAAGFWQQEEPQAAAAGTVFRPQLEEQQRKALLEGWNRAVGRSRNWSE